LNAAVIPSRLRGLVFFLVVAPLAVAFAWQGQIASFADDSASYLTLAHYFSPSGSPIVSEWAGYHSNFPPLLPLLLAFTGGVHNLHIAYALVAMFAAAGAALFYRYAALDLGERGGLLAAVLFLLTTTAWITLKGVLSETLYLFALMASLVYYETRIRGREPRTYEWFLFGLLLACAALSRAIGILLLAAYVLHLLVRAWKDRRLVARAWLPAVVVLVLAGLWYALRPKAPVDMYGMAAQWVAGWWMADPFEMGRGATTLIFSGWIRSFMADHDVTLGAKIVFGAVGLLALAEAIERAWRNRLDGWFVLLTLDVIFVWTFTPETTRRLLYPLVPLMILFAISLVRRLLARSPLHDRRRLLAVSAIVALPVLLVLPALWIMANKSFDHRPVIAGCPQQYREIAPYYSTLNLEEAEKLAVLEVSILCGLQMVDKVTPPNAVLMWSRPEYVTLLGHRRTVPMYYRWTPAEMRAAIARDKVDYVVVTAIFKNDIEGGSARHLADMKLEEYTQPAYALSSGIFSLRKVRRAPE
jgi:hypothetical protein